MGQPGRAFSGTEQWNSVNSIKDYWTASYNKGQYETELIGWSTGGGHLGGVGGHRKE